jgi:glycerophosphoryl diester phosphodiesterase
MKAIINETSLTQKAVFAKSSKVLKTSLFYLLMAGFSLNANAQKLNTVKIKNLKDLQSYFTYKADKPIIISGHRGGMLPGFPENAIESCEKTLSLMPSFFEIDPRLTKDSVLVLMHDKTINRTTNGKGKVSDYTYAELQKFNLKDREGNVTNYKIPTLLDMLKWGKGKTVFNFDNKEVPYELYSQFLKKHKFPNIILSVRSLEEALFYFKRNDDVMFCVEISNMDHYIAYEKSGIPWNRIMAYVGYKMNPEHKAVYDKLHANGVMCMIAVAPTQDKVKDAEEQKAAYLMELKTKPDIIETDYPTRFIGLPFNK